jgi:hypothetical protein
LVRDFHGSVGSTVIHPAADDRGRFALDKLIWGSVCVVDEEHAASRFQAIRQERPEGLKQFERYV